MRGPLGAAATTGPLSGLYYGDAGTRVVLAVVGGATTVSEIVAEVGRSRATVHAHLVRLRADGLVAWEDGLDGTIRPLVERVA